MKLITALVSGIFIGIAAGGLIEYYSDHSIYYRDEYNNSNKLIEECQKELPRNEYCVIVAVPEKKVKED